MQNEDKDSKIKSFVKGQINRHTLPQAVQEQLHQSASKMEAKRILRQYLTGL